MAYVKYDLRDNCWPRTKTNPVNLITHARTPLALLGAICGFYGWLAPSAWTVEAGLSLLVTSALTDTFDGWAARRFCCVSVYGSLLDTIQDKIFLVIVISSSLLPLAQHDAAHACFLVIFLAINVWRDNYVMALRCLGAKKGLSGQAQWFGKVRTICLMIFGCFLFAVAFHSQLVSFLPQQFLRPACFIMEGGLLVLTIATWIAYAHFYSAR